MFSGVSSRKNGFVVAIILRVCCVTWLIRFLAVHNEQLTTTRKWPGILTTPRNSLKATYFGLPEEIMRET